LRRGSFIHFITDNYYKVWTKTAKKYYVTAGFQIMNIE